MESEVFLEWLHHDWIDLTFVPGRADVWMNGPTVFRLSIYGSQHPAGIKQMSMSDNSTLKCIRNEREDGDVQLQLVLFK